MEACEAALCRYTLVVPRPSPETNAQKILKPQWAEQQRKQIK